MSFPTLRSVFSGNSHSHKFIKMFSSPYSDVTISPANQYRCCNYNSPIKTHESADKSQCGDLVNPWVRQFDLFFLGHHTRSQYHLFLSHIDTVRYISPIYIYIYSSRLKRSLEGFVGDRFNSVFSKSTGLFSVSILLFQLQLLNME